MRVHACYLFSCVFMRVHVCVQLCSHVCVCSQAGVDLWDTRGHARAQRPKEGWDWVVHPLQTKKKTRGKSKQLQSAAAIQAQYAEDKQSGARHAPYVAKADGSYRPLNEAEVYMLLRQQPKKRKNWYFSGRYPGK